MKFHEGIFVAPLPEDIQKLKWHGDFETALRVIEKRLASDIPDGLKERLRGEQEIIRLLPEEYPYSWEKAENILRENIQNFDQRELQEWWEENAVEWIYINGQVHIKDNFLSNLIKTREELKPRLTHPELAQPKEQNGIFLNKTVTVQYLHSYRQKSI